MPPELPPFFQALSDLPAIGIYLAALAANLTPIIPEEIFLLGYGYLSGEGVFNIYKLTVFLILGLFTTDILWFYMGMKGNRIVKKFISTILGKNFDEKDTSVETAIRDHVGKIIFISRFLTTIRAIGPVLAGSVYTPWKKFLTYNFFALIVYVPFILFLGRYFNERIERIISGVNVIENIVGFVLILIAAIFIIQKIRKQFVSNLKSVSIKDTSQKKTPE